jgi:hypothetical protein
LGLKRNLNQNDIDELVLVVVFEVLFVSSSIMSIVEVDEELPRPFEKKNRFLLFLFDCGSSP